MVSYAQGVDALNQSLSELRDIDVSFEFFPPKSEKMEQTLWKSVERLAPLKPSYISVSFTPGGKSPRKATMRLTEP